MKKLLKNYMLDGIILIIVGLILILWSRETLTTIYRIIGISVLVMGLLKILTFVLKKKEQSTGYCPRTGSAWYDYRGGFCGEYDSGKDGNRCRCFGICAIT